jgi:hypothetical protein
LARSAQGGHLLVDVAPQGTSTIVLWPVSGSIRRSGTGLTHTPWATATVSTIDVVSGGRTRFIAESVDRASVGDSTSGCASMSSMLTQPPDSPDRHKLRAISLFRVWWQRLMLVGADTFAVLLGSPFGRIYEGFTETAQNDAAPQLFDLRLQRRGSIRFCSR